MKLRNGIYFLLLLMACKDGGLVPNAALPGDWVQQYNQQVALNYVSGSSTAVFSYSAGGKEFTVPVPLPGTCNSPDSEVTIGEITERFSNVNCYSVNYQWMDDPFIYVISSSKRENRKLQILTYYLIGKVPENKTYVIDDFGISVGYSVYSLNDDGSINYDNQEYYGPFSGSVEVFNTFGHVKLSSDLYLRKNNTATIIRLASKLSCCY